MLRDSFGNTDDKANLGLDGLLDSTSCQRRTVAVIICQ